MRYSVELLINVEAEDMEAAFMKAVERVAEAGEIGPEAHLGYVIRETEGKGNWIEGMAYAPGMQTSGQWRMTIEGVEG